MHGNGVNDGAGGCGGGTVYGLDESGNINKALWSGSVGYVNQITNHEECAKPGIWTLIEGIYVASGSKRFKGQSSGYVITGNGGDQGGGGAGYYGGYGATHNNGGGGGGSAYADIEGILKQVTDIKGYCGYICDNGAEMSGRYGNGKLIISK